MRKYRINTTGQEKPVWLSKLKTIRLGEIEGRQAKQENRPMVLLGNLDHDNAARVAYAKETKC